MMMITSKSFNFLLYGDTFLRKSHDTTFILTIKPSYDFALFQVLVVIGMFFHSVFFFY